MIETLLRVNLPSNQTLSWLPHEQGVYKSTFMMPEDGYDAYYSQWTDAGYNTRRQIVGSVTVDLAPFSKKSSLSDCEGDDESFYWDNDKQTLYIHFAFDDIPSTTSISIGLQNGYSYIGTEESIYISDVEYPPRIKTTTKMQKKVDKFQVGKMRFQDQTITLNNGDGGLDDFIQNPLPGSEASIVLYDTSSSSELALYTGIITEDINTVDELTIKIQDKRRRENIKVPSTRFSSSTYGSIEDKYIGKIIPEGYGVNKGIKCYPVNGKVTSGNITFKYATDATTLTQVRVKEDDVWSTVSTAASTPASGTFELSYADATNASGAMLECVCDATLRSADNPGDIIKDMNDRYNSVSYDSTSYNQTEWATESALLADVSLYMKKDKEFFKWIEDLQNGSDLFFVYDIDGDGKRTLRVNDPNRDLARTINYWEIKDDKKKVERDFTEFSSAVTVLYGHNWQEDIDNRVFVDDYEDDVLDKYRFHQDSEFESLLPSSSDAQTKAEVIAEDQSEARAVVSVILHEENLSDIDLKLYDIVKVELKKPDVDHWVAGDDIYADYSASDSIEADYTESETITADYRGTTVVDVPGREYWGEIRGQVIGIGYNPSDLSYSLTIRERPESEVI